MIIPKNEVFIVNFDYPELENYNIYIAQAHLDLWYQAAKFIGNSRYRRYSFNYDKFFGWLEKEGKIEEIPFYSIHTGYPNTKPFFDFDISHIKE